MNRCLRTALTAAMAVAAGPSCTEPDAADGGASDATSPEEIWTVESEPSVTIGTIDGPPETLLYRATSAVVLSDGTIVIANAGSNELRFFDTNGQFLRNVGGEGDGPGEFRTLSGLWRMRGDTILAWDLRQRRLSYFTPEGEFLDVRSFVIPPIPLPSGIQLTNSVSFRGVFEDGSIVALPNSVAALTLALEGPGGRSEGHFRLDEPILVLPRDTTVSLTESGTLPPLDASAADTIGVFAGTEQYAYRAVARPGGGVQPTAWPVIFGEAFRWALGPHFVAVGTGKPYIVNLYDASGALRGTVSRPVPSVPVTDEMVRRYRDDVVAQASEELRAIRSTNLRRVPAAETLPAYGTLHFDRAGNLWVHELGLPGAAESEPYRYSIFAPDGRWLAQLEVPSELSVIDRGDDYLLTRALDDFGVEQIRLYRIRRGTGRVGGEAPSGSQNF